MDDFSYQISTPKLNFASAVYYTTPLSNYSHLTNNPR